MRLQPHWNFTSSRFSENVFDDTGTNTQTLKVRIDDQLAKIDFGFPVLYAGVAARYRVTQDDFVSGGGPGISEEFVLCVNRPATILKFNYLAVGTMMNGACELHICRCRRPSENIHTSTDTMLIAGGTMPGSLATVARPKQNVPTFPA